jgi:uncharacterized membrane protein (DUF4010 family)
MDRDLAGILLAAALGLLIGGEREWAMHKPIGLRSFALVGAAGGICAVLAGFYGNWILPAGLVSVAALVGVRLFFHQTDPEESAEDTGITTAVAALVTFLIGALAASSEWLHAVVLAGVVTLLLHWKRPMHATIERLGARDFEIVARFVLIALVVLPVLPNRTYDPYDAFNPFQSWLLVVLIVGLNLAGYVAFRLAGAASGAWLGGIIGGMISSTATTLSYSSMSRHQEGLGRAAALVIIVASMVVYPRVMIEIAVISPKLLQVAAAPMVVYAVLLLLGALIMSRWVRRSDMELPEQQNPARFGLAVSFAVVYVVILFAVAISKDLLGDEAIYLVALVSGLTDVDALTISIGQLHGKDGLSDSIAWRSIFLATLSNLLFKVGAAAVLGSADLRRSILPAGAVALVAGVLVLVLWP